MWGKRAQGLRFPSRNAWVRIPGLLLTHVRREERDLPRASLALAVKRVRCEHPLLRIFRGVKWTRHAKRFKQ